MHLAMEVKQVGDMFNDRVHHVGGIDDIGKVRKKRKTRRGKKKSRKSRDEATRFDSVACSFCFRCRAWSECAIACDDLCENLKLTRPPPPARSHLRPTDTPKAPRNSSTYIMEEHFYDLPDRVPYLNQDSPDYFAKRNSIETPSFPVSPDASFSSSSSSSNGQLDYLDLENTDVSIFMQQDFENTYKAARTEKLASMSKSELVKSILELENRAARLKESLENDCAHAKSERLQRETHLKMELERLSEENDLLKASNVELANNLLT